MQEALQLWAWHALFHSFFFVALCFFLLPAMWGDLFVLHGINLSVIHQTQLCTKLVSACSINVSSLVRQHFMKEVLGFPRLKWHHEFVCKPLLRLPKYHPINSFSTYIKCPILVLSSRMIVPNTILLTPITINWQDIL